MADQQVNNGVGTSVNTSSFAIDLNINGLSLVNWSVGDYVAASDASGSFSPKKMRLPWELIVAASDETTALTTGTGKVTWPNARDYIIDYVWASLTTAQTSGSLVTVDINQNGTSILSTKITFDNGERTSQTAATQPVLSDDILDINNEMSIDIDAIGDGTAAGLKVTFVGHYL